MKGGRKINLNNILEERNFHILMKRKFNSASLRLRHHGGGARGLGEGTNGPRQSLLETDSFVTGGYTNRD
jgi:hypothetical protein